MFVVILELVIGLKLLCPKNDLESKVLTKIWRQLSFERIPFEQFEAWCMNNFLIFFNCIFQFFKFCFNFKLNFGIFNIFLSKGSLQLLLWLFRHPSDQAFAGRRRPSRPRPWTSRKFPKIDVLGRPRPRPGPRSAVLVQKFSKIVVLGRPRPRPRPYPGRPRPGRTRSFRKDELISKYWTRLMGWVKSKVDGLGSKWMVHGV